MTKNLNDMFSWSKLFTVFDLSASFNPSPTYPLHMVLHYYHWSNYVLFLFLSICRSQWLDDEITRQSTCELEADAVAVDILNRLEIEGKNWGKKGEV